MKLAKSMGIAVLMIGAFAACGDKTSKSDLASATNTGEAESSQSPQSFVNEIKKDLDVGIQAIASKKYVETVKDASDMDPVAYTPERLVVGQDDRGFSLYVKVNFKMNASPDRIVDKITYFTPLILVRPVTFEMEVESLELSQESLRLDAACPLKLEDVQVLIAEALDRANRAFKSR